MEYMRVTDVMDTLKVKSKTTAYRIMREIGLIKIGGIICIRECDFTAYCDRKKQLPFEPITTPRPVFTKRDLKRGTGLFDPKGRVVRRKA